VHKPSGTLAVVRGPGTQVYISHLLTVNDVLCELDVGDKVIVIDDGWTSSSYINVLTRAGLGWIHFEDVCNRV